jgi:hypothetical protein
MSNQYKITGTSNFYSDSSGTVTFNPIMVNVPEPFFHCDIGPIQRDDEEVHIPYTDISFLRSRGKMSRVLTVSGVCTAESYSDCIINMFDLEQLSGDKCSIYYNGVTFGDAHLVEYIYDGPKLCQEPGFYYEYNLVFRQMTVDTFPGYPS